MEIIAKARKMCPFCMQEHEISIVRVNEKTVFKGVEVNYDATYEYCDVCEEFSSTEEMMSANDIAVKAAYRSSVGLLTPSEIIAIRNKYGISQSDFCTLLGWGAKTIARYETHQVQTVAHDSILRKIDSDPEWFLQLLDKAKGSFSDSVFRKYHSSASRLFAEKQDNCLRKSIEAQYTRYRYDGENCGGTALESSKAVEGGASTMCKVMQEFIDKARLEGRQEEKLNNAKALLMNSVSPEIIADALKMPMAQVEQLQSQLRS